MNAKNFSSRFFTVRQIARATGMDKVTVRRQAQQENWPSRPRGNRTEYSVPRHLVASLKEAKPARSIFDQAETIRALNRACVVRGFIQEVQRNPKRGIERALEVTVSQFQHLTPLSVRALRQWVQNIERGGLGALHEHKLGRVGRRARALHKMLK